MSTITIDPPAQPQPGGGAVDLDPFQQCLAAVSAELTTSPDHCWSPAASGLNYTLDCEEPDC